MSIWFFDKQRSKFGFSFDTLINPHKHLRAMVPHGKLQLVAQRERSKLFENAH